MLDVIHMSAKGEVEIAKSTNLRESVSTYFCIYCVRFYKSGEPINSRGCNSESDAGSYK